MEPDNFKNLPLVILLFNTLLKSECTILELFYRFFRIYILYLTVFQSLLKVVNDVLHIFNTH